MTFPALTLSALMVVAHRRDLDVPLDGTVPLRIWVRDPEYDVQFDIPEPPRIDRADCSADLRMGDARAVADAMAENPDLGPMQDVLVTVAMGLGTALVTLAVAGLAVWALRGTLWRGC